MFLYEFYLLCALAVPAGYTRITHTNPKGLDVCGGVAVWYQGTGRGHILASQVHYPSFHVTKVGDEIVCATCGNHVILECDVEMGGLMWIWKHPFLRSIVFGDARYAVNRSLN